MVQAKQKEKKAFGTSIPLQSQICFGHFTVPPKTTCSNLFNCAWKAVLKAKKDSELLDCNWSFGPDVFLRQVDLRPGESASEVRGCRFGVDQGCICYRVDEMPSIQESSEEEEEEEEEARSLSLHPG